VQALPTSAFIRIATKLLKAEGSALANEDVYTMRPECILEGGKNLVGFGGI